MSTSMRTLTAPNPGPMTLQGTNTYVVGSVVIDPGPRDEEHLRAVVDAAREQAGAVTMAVLTHGHPDHSEGAARFAELADCPVRAYDRRHCLGAEPLTDGEVIGCESDSDSDREALTTFATPGHTWDSVTFWLADQAVLFTGDTVLGQGTTMVAHPDGALGPYLASLSRMLEMAHAGEVTRILPGHGPVVQEPVQTLEYYLAHRAERLQQVRAAVRTGAQTARDVVRTVYADVDPSVWPAAEQSVQAQLDYLRAEGQRSGGHGGEGGGLPEDA